MDMTADHAGTTPAARHPATMPAGRPVRRRWRTETGLLALGLGAILVYDVTSAAKEVFAGSLLRGGDPFVLVALCFGLATLLFQAVTLGSLAVRRSAPGPVPWADLAALNATTAAAWLALYIALALAEPAIVSAISGGVGPLAIYAWERLTGRPRRSPREFAGCWGVLLGCGVLAWGSVAGLSGLGGHAAAAGWLGPLAAAAAGLFATSTMVWSKRLAVRGWRPATILAHRFYLLVAIAGAVALSHGHPVREIPSWQDVALVALPGIALPLYALQVGIRHCPSYIVVVVLGLSPLFTLLFQVFDRELHWSSATFAGVLLLVAGTYLSLPRSAFGKVTPE
jgi:drug/metabolite transporter (DMT)-like permease